MLVVVFRSLRCCLSFGLRRPVSVMLLFVASRKTTTRKSRCFCALHHHGRMLMSSCHIASEHRHHLAFACIKIFSEKPILFSKRPVFVEMQNPGLRIILFV